MNTFAPINPALIDVRFAEHTGYPDEFKSMDTIDVLRDVCGAATREFPKEWWIEPRDWEERARENDKNNAWAINYIDRFTNQHPTHECTCHSLRANFESAWNLQRAMAIGPPEKDVRKPLSEKSGSIWVSPLSVYCEANPGQWGGANVRQVLEIALRRGFLPEPVQPRQYKLKYTLHGTTGQGNSNQASGKWVRLRDIQQQIDEVGKFLKPLEVIFAESYEQAVCIVLNTRTNSVGRNGHAVPWCFWNAANRAMGYVDSYDVVRYDSERTARSAWQGSFCIASTVVPDDWDDPVPVR